MHSGDSDTNTKLLADRRRLTRIALDTHLACQVCGHSFQEGEDITAYAYRAAGEPTFAIGYIMCGHDTHEHPTVFARGVCEYVLTGHIGTCADVRTQSTEYVLLEPTVVVSSPPTSEAPHVHPEAPTPRTPTKTTRREPPSLLVAVRSPPRADGRPLREESD